MFTKNFIDIFLKSSFKNGFWAKNIINLKKKLVLKTFCILAIRFEPETDTG